MAYNGSLDLKNVHITEITKIVSNANPDPDKQVQHSEDILGQIFPHTISPKRFPFLLEDTKVHSNDATGISSVLTTKLNEVVQDDDDVVLERSSMETEEIIPVKASEIIEAQGPEFENDSIVDGKSLPRLESEIAGRLKAEPTSDLKETEHPPDPVSELRTTPTDDVLPSTAPASVLRRQSSEADGDAQVSVREKNAPEDRASIGQTLAKKRKIDETTVYKPEPKRPKLVQATLSELFESDRYKQMSSAWKTVDARKEVYPSEGLGWAEHFEAMVRVTFKPGDPGRTLRCLTDCDLGLRFIMSIGSCQSLLRLRSALLSHGHWRESLECVSVVHFSSLPDNLEDQADHLRCIAFSLSSSVGFERMRKMWFHQVLSSFKDKNESTVSQKTRGEQMKIRDESDKLVMKTIYGPSPHAHRDPIDHKDPDVSWKRKRYVPMTSLAGKRWKRFCEEVGSESALWLPLDPALPPDALERKTTRFCDMLLAVLAELAPYANKMSDILHKSRLIWEQDITRPPKLLALHPTSKMYQRLQNDECTAKERIALLKTVDTPVEKGGLCELNKNGRYCLHKGMD